MPGASWFACAISPSWPCGPRQRRGDLPHLQRRSACRELRWRRDDQGLGSDHWWRRAPRPHWAFWRGDGRGDLCLERRPARSELRSGLDDLHLGPERGRRPARRAQGSCRGLSRDDLRRRQRRRQSGELRTRQDPNLGPGRRRRRVGRGQPSVCRRPQTPLVLGSDDLRHLRRQGPNRKLRCRRASRLEFTWRRVTLARGPRLLEHVRDF
mmetsp:Transcript_8741/g.36179  ORF Transcript_8741/g.36179 Transcript_8741/m.36179 type:complete len:210 (-) Transcript_8741:3167-3796(-)